MVSISGKALFKSLLTFPHSMEDMRQTVSSRVHGVRLAVLLGVAALILVIAVVFMAYMSIARSERDMAGLLAAKGASLLMVFESALKTGMQAQEGLILQDLLQEMVKSKDIEFVAVTMPDGTVIAHSDQKRLGEILRLKGEDIDADKIDKLAPTEKEQWAITSAEGKKVFLLYRYFTLGSKNWPDDLPEPTIFLGLDISPFEITSLQNRNYIIILSLILVFAGLLLLVAIYFSQRADKLQVTQHKTESELQRMAEEMQRHEKLAAIGTLAAKVAHEIRNPLSSIKGYATYFRQSFKEGSDDWEAATVMINEVTRLNRVITDLLELSRPETGHYKLLEPKIIFMHVMKLLRKKAEEINIELRLRTAPVIPEILGDVERLTQAFLNLCLNALEASSPGSVVTLAISGGKNRICMMILDEGHGIAPEILEKIFDPYFTTKESGTGLGLPMVHRIIHGHKGEMDVKSRLAGSDGTKGMTIFRIWLSTSPIGNYANGEKA